MDSQELHDQRLYVIQFWRHELMASIGQAAAGLVLALYAILGALRALRDNRDLIAWLFLFVTAMFIASAANRSRNWKTDADILDHLKAEPADFDAWLKIARGLRLSSDHPRTRNRAKRRQREAAATAFDVAATLAEQSGDASLAAGLRVEAANLK